jgi:hypothetical protein
MLPQDELRRRIRAAMALAGIASWDELAERTPYSRSTIKDLGTIRGTVEETHLFHIARACDVPYEWFTVADLRRTVEADQPTIGEHIEALRRRLTATERLGTQRWGEAMRLHDELLARVNQAHERITHNDERILRLTSGSLGEPANGTHGLREAADLLDDAAQQANTPPDESGEEPPADSQEG